MMSIYFRVFPKNGTAKPAKSWAVMGFPAISTVMAGQRGGGYIGTNKTVFLDKISIPKNDLKYACINYLSKKCCKFN
jgi:hypothetical protein